MKKIILCIGFSMFMTTALFAQSINDEEAVKNVLNSYKKAIESLDTIGIGALFVAGSKVFEGGKAEGTVQNYLNHHLGPELHLFKSFTFSDYKVDVKVEGSIAYSSETYLYTIILVKDAKEIKKPGVATSFLKKENGRWSIVQTHSSFRRAK